MGRMGNVPKFDFRKLQVERDAGKSSGDLLPERGIYQQIVPSTKQRLKQELEHERCLSARTLRALSSVESNLQTHRQTKTAHSETQSARPKYHGDEELVPVVLHDSNSPRAQKILNKFYSERDLYGLTQSRTSPRMRVSTPDSKRCSESLEITFCSIQH